MLIFDKVPPFYCFNSGVYSQFSNQCPPPPSSLPLPTCMHADNEESHSASASVGAKLPSPLKFSEVKGDLFSCPSTSSLAHCVSEDMAMGKGVAVLFKKEFGGVGELKAQGIVC